ncbi:ribonucleotide reductase subunit alpha [Glaciecola sp. MF2-115]|uniref:ribonucleotide reductase subunit alpha n=1 Tax=Glaciecola sp. MF2-115 TaxID=3384827 RepID=UPI00173A9C05|eukprot:CAMPEP_0182899918 /NCGR_PEP_ID=MMETSP0034_2-20130328/28414_1 /TAXON_ID=156128 /ORGANISM="Nephroselmis pyriformis, Strain CCMP717" /LENGTH=130 /DNA_ID=CAMNT_0025034003 /DNA_START=9 /DNA_END=401 /DNA_ORIENTATION=+
MISMFSDLLEMSGEQPDPQRLLFLFAAADPTNKSAKREDKKGTIEPTMVVDKLPSEVPSFEALIKEADSINKKWDFVFIASLSGQNKQPPSSEDAEPFLDQMTDDVMTGKNIRRYVVFDRKENPIELLAS